MSKTITYTGKKWAGSVTLSEPLTLPQAEAFEAGLVIPKDYPTEGSVFHTVMDKEKLPALLACVEKWELSNFPAEVNAHTFPFSPRGANHELITWLYSEIGILYAGEAEIPNE